MSAAIQVLAIRALDGKSNVKAFCDVQIGGITIKGAKIVQQDGQRPWLAMPSVKTERAWANVIEITSKDLRQRITEVVLAAWATHQPRDLPTRGGRQSHEPLEERADNWMRRQALPESGDPGQHDTGHPGRPFDDECPF
jgi:DNA-binding cell septation regulator SpoVG